jgi:hypothetical protein
LALVLPVLVVVAILALPTIASAGVGVCGDGFCDAASGETAANCAIDCAGCAGSCGGVSPQGCFCDPECADPENDDCCANACLVCGVGCVAVGTPTATLTPPPTLTPVRTLTLLPTNTPTAPTPTATPVEPTATDTPIAPTATDTPVEPTATETPVEPTATETPVEPTVTETPVEPTSTETPVATPTRTSTPTVAATATPQPGLDHFQCYELHGRRLNTQVSLVDAFGSTTPVARHAKRLCAPADKNGEDPAAPNDLDHLTGYVLRRSAPFKRLRDQEVVNQFHPAGVLVDLLRPEMLLVPTGKSLTDPPPAYTPGIDHFQCYRVSGASFLRNAVTVTDQFGEIIVGVKRALRLCVPVDKNGEGILDGSTALMCYKARSRSGPPTSATLFTTNQLEDATDFVFGLREFCVPSQLNPGDATPTPIATATPTATETATPVPTVTSTPSFTCGGFAVAGQCGGSCPTNQVCSTAHAVIGGNLTCECVSGSTPCNGRDDPTFPTCGGDCAAGLGCESVTLGTTNYCVCADPAETCTTGVCGIGLVCPTNQTCVNTAGNCGCVADNGCVADGACIVDSR